MVFVHTIKIQNTDVSFMQLLIIAMMWRKQNILKDKLEDKHVLVNSGTNMALLYSCHKAVNSYGNYFKLSFKITDILIASEGLE